MDVGGGVRVVLGRLWGAVGHPKGWGGPWGGVRVILGAYGWQWGALWGLGGRGEGGEMGRKWGKGGKRGGNGREMGGK